MSKLIWLENHVPTGAAFLDSCWFLARIYQTVYELLLGHPTHRHHTKSRSAHRAHLRMLRFVSCKCWRFGRGLCCQNGHLGSKLWANRAPQTLGFWFGEKTWFSDLRKWHYKIILLICLHIAWAWRKMTHAMVWRPTTLSLGMTSKASGKLARWV